MHTNPRTAAETIPIHQIETVVLGRDAHSNILDVKVSHAPLPVPGSCWFGRLGLLACVATDMVPWPCMLALNV